MSAVHSVTMSHLLEPGFMQQQPVEAANLLERLDVAEAVAGLGTCAAADVALVLERTSPTQAELLLTRLEPALASAVVGRMSVPRAALLLRMMNAEQRTGLLDSLDEEAQGYISQVLGSPPDSAAAMMDPRVMQLHPTMPVQEALALLRRLQYHRTYTQAQRIMLLLDAERHIEGMVAIQDLALAAPDELLSDYMQPVPVTVERTTSREELLALLEEHRVSSVPVVDDQERLIGIVRHDELAAIAREDAAGDIQAMFGVSRSEQALSPPWYSVAQRLPWLQINLLTAFAAAAVVGLFEDTIASFTALAVLLPVVAGQSGNTGAQALAVVMRGLALREISIAHWPWVLRKELLVSIMNGIGIAATAALAVYLWSGSSGLTLIIALAMLLSMAIAGISGAAVPLLLTRMGLDPAQSSSIILTTVTDVAGFFSFLGIASLLLGHI